MISVCNLFWIIPLCYFVGMITCAFWTGSNALSREEYAYRKGIQDGIASVKNNNLNINNLSSYIYTNFDGNRQQFIEATEGIFYGVDITDQTFIIVVKDEEQLEKYLDKVVISIVEDGHIKRPMILSEII